MPESNGRFVREYVFYNINYQDSKVFRISQGSSELPSHIQYSTVELSQQNMFDDCFGEICTHNTGFRSRDGGTNLPSLFGLAKHNHRWDKKESRLRT